MYNPNTNRRDFVDLNTMVTSQVERATVELLPDREQSWINLEHVNDMWPEFQKVKKSTRAERELFLNWSWAYLMWIPVGQLELLKQDISKTVKKLESSVYLLPLCEYLCLFV